MKRIVNNWHYISVYIAAALFLIVAFLIRKGVHVHGGVDDFWGVDGDEQSVCAVGRTTYFLSRCDMPRRYPLLT